MDRSGSHNSGHRPAENEGKGKSAEGELGLFRTCLVCKRDLTNREPRLLPCLHSFCRDCVPAEIRSLSPTTAACQESNREGIICCPACRQTCFTGDVVENVFIREYRPVSQNMDKHCSNCEKKPAFKFCSHCTKWLCGACSKEHLHGEGTMLHKLLTSGDEDEVNELSLLCPLHTKEPLTLFCETCDMLACWSCQLTQHKEHSFKYLEDVLQNQKVILDELSLKMEEKKVKIQNSAKQVQDRLNEVMQVRTKVENQIKMAKMIMISELNKRMNILMDQVERITNERKLKLEHQLQAVMGLCRHLEHVLNFINWAVSKKNNIPFLFSKELILFQMRRLLETQSNTDLSPSKIHFHWDSLLWTKKLSTLGHLSFDSEISSHQDRQSPFPQQQSPVPSDPADHRPCLPPSILCHNPGQQYSVCSSRCPDPRQIQKAQDTVNCLQNHQTLGELAGDLQHQLQYSGMQQRRSQQNYLPHPFPVQPIPALRPWHIAPSGPEQNAVLVGHLQAQRLQPGQHSAYTVPQQRSMTPMHMETLQQPNQLAHQPQQKQPFQMHPLKLLNQPSVQQYPLKQKFPPEQIQHQTSVKKSQGKFPPFQEAVQQSQSQQMPIAQKDPLEQPRLFSQKLQDMQSAQNIVRQLVLTNQDMAVEPQHCGQQVAMVTNQDQQSEKNPVPQLDGIIPTTTGDSDTRIPKESTEAKSEKTAEVSDTRVQKDTTEAEFKENSCKEPMNLSVNAENPNVDLSQNLSTDSLDGTPNDKTNPRAEMDGVKVPYVRLERLEICAPSTGPIPSFKVQSTVDEDGSKQLLKMDSQTSNTASRNITLDSTLTPPNSNPPPPQQCELDDAAITTDLLPDDAAFPSPLDDKKASEANTLLTPEAAGATDNNEDYCAVCLNGGELLCCDRCPKVFHLGCHVPSLLSFPMGEWLCTFCRNVVMPEVEYDCENTRHINETRGIRTLQGLSISDQRKCEKLTLHLYCYPLSLPFHEPVSPLARHYYQIIKRPMDLSTVRAKLQKKSPLHYYTPEEFISDIQLMFMNCAKFNYPDSEVAQAGRSLEIYFDEKLREIYPNKSFAGATQEYSDNEEIDNESGTVTINGFTWPTEGKEPVKPKRRRRHGASHSHKDHK
ncbi:tripartite motif-containing protein 66 isoform X3 [Narcine bancroftii]|uniref:tripartite motif-containing protein 66 isoform X3 n=1 Tax=Narcine bancroftii TaxID=1343680 RepID=UPI0038321457